MGQLKRFFEAGGELPSQKGTNTRSAVERAASKAAKLAQGNSNMGYPIAAQRTATSSVSASEILSELGRRGAEKRRTI